VGTTELSTSSPYLPLHAPDAHACGLKGLRRFSSNALLSQLTAMT
jgi:hypothetical protein